MTKQEQQEQRLLELRAELSNHTHFGIDARSGSTPSSRGVQTMGRTDVEGLKSETPMSSSCVPGSEGGNPAAGDGRKRVPAFETGAAPNNHSVMTEMLQQNLLGGSLDDLCRAVELHPSLEHGPVRPRPVHPPQPPADVKGTSTRAPPEPPGDGIAALFAEKKLQPPVPDAYVSSTAAADKKEEERKAFYVPARMSPQPAIVAWQRRARRSLEFKEPHRIVKRRALATTRPGGLRPSVRKMVATNRLGERQVCGIQGGLNRSVGLACDIHAMPITETILARRQSGVSSLGGLLGGGVLGGDEGQFDDASEEEEGKTSLQSGYDASEEEEDQKEDQEEGKIAP